MRMSPVFVKRGGPKVVYGTLPKPLGLWASTKVGFTSPGFMDSTLSYGPKRKGHQG